jgi:Fur family zinc uptake transcriptional regulator
MTLQGKLNVQLHHAECLIKASGTRLTDHRLKLLGLLYCSGKPLSAYEITKLFNCTYNEKVIANSVYRTLNDLISAQLAYRLNTINKYIVRNTIKQGANKPFALFVICSKCLHVEEEQAPIAMVKALAEKTRSNNFEGITPQLELSGLCSKCHKQENLKKNENF